MNGYSEDMKSEDASPALRRFTEEAALSGHPQAPPQERFYEDFALLARRPTDGWAIGFRVDFTSETWSIAEVVALPAQPAQTLPPVNSEEIRDYIESAVDRARGRRAALAKQLAMLSANAEFIRERFETWRDKNAPRTNVEYAALATKYAEQVRLGNNRATATLAEQVEMSPAVMAQRIKEARRRRLLTSGEQGRASGTLTSLGALYTDPSFPGMRNLRRTGMLLREISDNYGVPEWLVWAGIVEERPEHGESLSLEDFMPKVDGEH